MSTIKKEVGAEQKMGWGIIFRIQVTEVACRDLGSGVLSGVKKCLVGDLSGCMDILVVQRDEEEKIPDLRLPTRMKRWGCDHPELEEQEEE